jgi:uncharacterized OB-fold protein
VTTDRETSGWFAAAAEGQLTVQVCAPAGHVLHLPKGYCHRCDTFETRWWPVSGDATVHTWTVVEHSVDDAFPAPYTVVLVELVEMPGVRFVTHLDGRHDLAPGLTMAVWFDRLDDGVVVPRWAPT